jgi:hypothetical protein
LKVEALQALLEWEAGHRRLHRRVPLLLGSQLAAQQLGEKLAVGDLPFAGILQQQWQLLGRAHQLQVSHLLLDLLDGKAAHDATPAY